jgi:antitoxin VapB
MTTAKIFMTGRSQAVRLPKEFRFEGSEVEIFRRGDEVILRARPENGAAVFDLLSKLPDDFMEEGRQDAAPQERDSF